MNKVKKIAVIGAGISGLTAARELKKSDFEVTVFEKARGAGGRASTRRDGDYRFDHGAQYFTARDNRFISQVKDWQRQGIVESWKGRIVAVRDGKITADKSTMMRYAGVPGMNALAKDLAAGVDIRYSTRIEEIKDKEKGKRKKACTERSRSERRLVLTDMSGEIYGPYDIVVVTTPPVQAVPLLTVSPQLAETVSGIYLEPCWAVMAVFDQQLNVDFDGAFMHQSPLGWVSRNSSKPGRPEPETWILHANAQWSREHIEKDPEWVAEELLSAFFSIKGQSEISPSYVKAHRWRYSIAKNPLSEGSLWDNEAAIGVAGDWCNESRIEGAYLSGLSIAGRVREL